MLFAAFLFWQRSIAFTPIIVQVYSFRYLIYAGLLLFLVRPEVSYCAVKASKIYALICALSILIEVAVTGSRSGGLLASYQSAGMMMSVGCILWLIDYYREGGLCNIAGALFCVFALATSGKRMFSIIAIGAFVVLFYFSRRKTGQRATVAFIGGLIGLGASLLLLYMFVPAVQELINRFVLMEEGSFTATSGRNLLWDAAWDIFLAHPYTGIGFGCFEDYYQAFYSGNRGSAYLTHNIYYGLLAETGLVGFALFVAMFLWGLVFTWKVWRKTDKSGSRGPAGYLAIYSLAMQLWFVIYGFTGNGIYDANEMFFYISAVGIALSLKWYPVSEGSSTDRQVRIASHRSSHYKQPARMKDGRIA